MLLISCYLVKSAFLFHLHNLPLPINDGASFHRPIVIQTQLRESQIFDHFSLDFTFPASYPECSNISLVPLAFKINGQLLRCSLRTQVEKCQTLLVNNGPKDNGFFENTGDKFGPGGTFSCQSLEDKSRLRLAKYGCSVNVDGVVNSIGIYVPYRWKSGKYTIQIIRLDRETIQQNRFIWAGCFLKNASNGETIFLGAIRLDGTELKLDPVCYSTIEISTKSEINKSDLFCMAIGNVKINHLAVSPKSVRAFLAPGLSMDSTAISLQETKDSLPFRILSANISPMNGSSMILLSNVKGSSNARNILLFEGKAK